MLTSFQVNAPVLGLFEIKNKLYMIWNLNKKKISPTMNLLSYLFFFSQFSENPLTKFPSYSDSLFYVIKIYLIKFDNKKRKMDDFFYLIVYCLKKISIRQYLNSVIMKRMYTLEYKKILHAFLL